jgi:hypothetical protein
VFTYLLFALALWVLEADRRRPARRVWVLVPLAALWTNLHGGFLALVATVGIYAAAAALQRQWAEAKRYGLLLAGVAAATLVTPYGYHLHRHIFGYLRSDFILNHVMEFRAPTFRGEGMRYFEALLFAGLASVPALLRRRQVATALLLLVWRTPR